MNKNRDQVLEWIEQGRIRQDGLPQALRIARAVPDRADWRNFMDSVALWLGAVFCAAAVIFFFAYNWAALGRFAKFGLVEALLLIAVAACWRLGLDRLSGKAALLAATLLVGAVLALVGQTYQTGADTFELFAFWAVAVLPWVLVGRFGALWLLWIGLLNLAVVGYFHAFEGVLGFIFGRDEQLWPLFILNTIALCAWETGAFRGIAWLQERWSARILASASGGLATALAVWSVFESASSSRAGFLAYLLWLAAAYMVYRRLRPDLFVLAGGVLSVVIVVSSVMLKIMEAGGLLLTGMAIIAISAFGAMWIKGIAAEQRS
jgi:uncharacterized membrane protein